MTLQLQGLFIEAMHVHVDICQYAYSHKTSSGHDMTPEYHAQKLQLDVCLYNHTWKVASLVARFSNSVNGKYLVAQSMVST